jgi:hypothetical protein
MLASLKTVERMFLKHVGAQLVPDGFQYDKERESYGKRFNDVTSFYCHTHPVQRGKIILQPGFSITHRKVESIFHTAMETPEKYWSGTSVLWTRASNLIGCKQEEAWLCVSSNEEVPTAAEDFIEMYRHYGLKFFCSNATLPEMDCRLNSEPSAPCRYQPSAPHRFGFGVIVSVLLRGVDATRALYAVYEPQMAKESGGFYYKGFTQLLNEDLYAESFE